MGAAPVRPPIEGIDLKGIHSLTTIEDVQALTEAVQNKPGGSAVIVA